jgi:hypothetical protein
MAKLEDRLAVEGSRAMALSSELTTAQSRCLHAEERGMELQQRVATLEEEVKLAQLGAAQLEEKLQAQTTEVK